MTGGVVVGNGTRVAPRSGGPREPAAGQYPCHNAEMAACQASDNGRKLHELPWLYLDSVGQEYGPVPGCTMREWLTLGRFPVGGDLRVRLPEWEKHLPLHKLFPDLQSAFVLPPAWPDFYTDGALPDDERTSGTWWELESGMDASSCPYPPEAAAMPPGVPTARPQRPTGGYGTPAAPMHGGGAVGSSSGANGSAETAFGTSAYATSGSSRDSPQMVSGSTSGAHGSHLAVEEQGDQCAGQLLEDGKLHRAQPPPGRSQPRLREMIAPHAEPHPESGTERRTALAAVDTVLQ